MHALMIFDAVCVVAYAAISILCITSFVRASTLNPGALHVTQESQGMSPTDTHLSFTSIFTASIHLLVCMLFTMVF